MAADVKDILLAAKDLIAVTVPLASIWVTHQFMSKREEDKYSKDFKQRKIDEFYGPMLSMTLELRGRRDAYEEIIQALQEKTDSHKFEDQSESLEERKEDFAKLTNTKIESSDKELIQSMQSLYREKLWMAEPSTVDLFQSFIAWTEISSIDSPEFASWKSLKKYAKKQHLFEQMEKNLRSNKEKLLQELELV